MKTESERKIQHSAVPYEIDKRSSCAVKDATGRMVASTAVHTSNRDDGEHAEVNEANAAFIVTACNAHDALEHALERAVAQIERLAERSFVDVKSARDWIKQCPAIIEARRVLGTRLKLVGKEGE